MPETILEIKNLIRSVVNQDKKKLTINNFSFDFEWNKIYSVIGASGSGKSSLLRMLNRLDEPDSGTIKFKNKNMFDINPLELRQKIGYLFQTPYLFESTVRDNLLYACSDLSGDGCFSLLDRVHIEQEFLDRTVDDLSIGEKQRVAIARLLATDPEVILLDEPTSALDPGHTRAIEELILEIVESDNITAIVVTHSPEQTLRLGGEALMMDNGRLVEHGPTDEIINNPQSEVGKRYKAREV